MDKEFVIGDIKIAKQVLEESPVQLACPPKNVLMEIYCIPSHNHNTIHFIFKNLLMKVAEYFIDPLVQKLRSHYVNA